MYYVQKIGLQTYNTVTYCGKCKDRVKTYILFFRNVKKRGSFILNFNKIFVGSHDFRNNCVHQHNPFDF